jgi:hypothetical protein
MKASLLLVDLDLDYPLKRGEVLNYHAKLAQNDTLSTEDRHS